MRPLSRCLYCAASLIALLLALPRSPPPASLAQARFASEPTYRFAGRYEGEWTADMGLESTGSWGMGGTLLEQRAGELRGTVSLDVGCDGGISGQARGQTRLPSAFAGVADGAEGPRVLTGTLNLAAEGALAGALASRGAEGTASAVEAALAGTLRDLAGDLETVATPHSLQRWYAGAGWRHWALQEGEPGRLAGTTEGTIELSVPIGAYEPGLALRSSGRWVAARVAVALCPWRGSVMVSGAVGNEQLHEERLDFTFRPTADGRLEGEGRGEAAIRGGPQGGCEYSGGGPFAVRVLGEAHDGRFRFRLEDFEQPQLLVRTICAGGRFVGPQAPLSTLFGWIDLAEAVDSQAHGELPPTAPDVRAMLDITIAPAAGAAPP